MDQKTIQDNVKHFAAWANYMSSLWDAILPNNMDDESRYVSSPGCSIATKPVGPLCTNVI